MRLAKCQECGLVKMVNVSDGRGYFGEIVIAPGEYCGDCWDRLCIRESKCRRHGVSGISDDGPEWDNVVRASEEDR